MEIRHITLGRSWQYDNKISHNGYTNKITFNHRRSRITLIPLSPQQVRDDEIKFKEKIEKEKIERENKET